LGQTGGGEFHLADKVAYYNELDFEEIGAVSDKDIALWGNAIIAGYDYSPEPNILPDGNDYCGRRFLETVDYSLKNGKTISFINFYGKHAPNGGYPILEHGIDDIKHTVENNLDNHLIVLAGDFNSDPVKEPEFKRLFFDKLEELGFVNCTHDAAFENTMVPNARPWPNDKVFVNKPYHGLVKCSLRYDTTLELSDHRPIECIINRY
jgi:hypothetical protein